VVKQRCAHLPQSFHSSKEITSDTENTSQPGKGIYEVIVGRLKLGQHTSVPNELLLFRWQ
jgi:hypothetical protein